MGAGAGHIKPVSSVDVSGLFQVSGFGILKVLSRGACASITSLAQAFYPAPQLSNISYNIDVVGLLKSMTLTPIYELNIEPPLTGGAGTV